VQVGTLGARFHLLDVARLTRRVACVPTGTPLAEALRQAEEQRGWGVVVVDSKGSPVALMHGSAAASVPAERRPWVDVNDVSRSLSDAETWDPGWRGEEVVDAMRRRPADEYAVAADGHVLGIVRAADIAEVLDPRKQPPDAGDDVDPRSTQTEDRREDTP
ncbi:MAG: CBS domain-containing protein, partial [Stackebrandtia sp.]